MAGRPTTAVRLHDDPEDAAKMTRTWHSPQNAGGYTTGSNDRDNLDPEILLTDLEKLKILPLGRMQPSSLWLPAVLGN